MKMESSRVLDELIEGRVLEEADEENFTLTDEFQTTLNQTRRRLDDFPKEQLEAELATVVEDADLVQSISSTTRAHDAIVTILALAAHVNDLDNAEIMSVVPLVFELLDEPPRDDGAPEAFLPVSGDSLECLLKLHSRVIVYVWMDDCDPCDAMRMEFDYIFEGPDEELALFAVYGPDWAEFLAERYDVAGAPTTLFVIDGSADARLQGAHHRDVIENEIHILREI